MFKTTNVINSRTFPLCVLASVFLCSVASVAQRVAPAVRIVSAIDESQRVTLTHTVSPLANAANDRGAAPDGMQLDRMQLVLQRSPAQETALRQLIAQINVPGSPSYHQWLTPDQFGAQFGPSDQDVATITSWLGSHGFAVSRVNPGKATLEFSGSVAQLREAFHTQIHKYSINGETHYANANDPQIPAALAPVIGGFASLNNFRVKRQVRLKGEATYDPKTDKATPQWTIGNSSGISFVLAPQDYYVQYDLNPLYSAGINGSGQTIAIINDSNINIDIVNRFRTLFNLPANPPQVIIDGNDPGVDGINNPGGPNDDSIEAYLDVEWSGAIAPNATIDLVIAANTALESGVILAAEHAVYGNVAPVISLSFGACEAEIGSENVFLNDLWEQAAAQGQTVMVSTGDSGSASCDDGGEFAVDGQTVSGFASTPYNVAVGGTDFFYSDYSVGGATLDNQIASYWNETPSDTTPAVSIKGVIPEQPWNDSQFGLNILPNIYAESGDTETTIAGGSGGASNAAVCSGNDYDSNTGLCDSSLSGYPKPSWQTGTGVPSDSVRDIPDVSLFAADGSSNASFYPECWEDGDCQPAASGGTVQITAVGGTSASSPSFAGIMALVNQKYGRQGQANTVLYPLKAQFPAAFHNVANGTNSMPCEYSATASQNSPDCISVSSPIVLGGAITEGQIGTGTTPEYNAATGYNPATGLGTIDAANLVNNWGNVKFAATSTTMTPSSTSFTHGTAITVSGNVTGTGTPTGDVALMTDSTEPANQGQTFFTLSSGSYTSKTSFPSGINFLPGGTYNIWGQYGGDSNNAESSSTKTQITVTPEASTTYFNILDVANPSETGTVKINPGTTGIPYGTQLILDAEALPATFYNTCVNTSSPPASCNTAAYTNPTGTITFADNGAAINTAIINTEGDAEYNALWSVGNHSVTASYPGDNSYKASTGVPTSPITFSIIQNTPALNISAASQALTNTGDVAGGQANAFNVQVENSANFQNESTYEIGYSNPTIAPTGTVTVTGFPSGVPTSATLSAAVDPTTHAAEGVGAILAPAGTAAGTYTVTVSYIGDGNYAATSEPFPVTIAASTGLASTTAASITGSISPNTNITVIGTVTGQGTKAPTGAVLFYSSGYNLGVVGIAPGTTGDVSTFAVVLNSRDLFEGTNLVTVQYIGDTTYAPSATTLSPISSPLSDFTLVPNTTIVPVTAGSSGTTSINLASVNGFSGAVSLTAACTATGVTCSLSPSAVTLAGAGSGSSTLTINAGSSTPNGSYNVLVTGTDPTGEFIHTLAITAVVSGSTAVAANFALTNTGAITVAQGATTGNTSTITVTPSNGFTGTVGLTCAVTTTLSNPTSPATCSLASPSVDITGISALTDVLTVTTTATTTAGNYTVTVTGTSGGNTATTAVNVTVTSTTPIGTYTVSVSNPSSGISPGSNATSTITAQGSGGYTGSVTLTCSLTSSPSGASDLPGCSITYPSGSAVPLSAGDPSGQATATVTTTAASSADLVYPKAGKDKGWPNSRFAAGAGATLAVLIFFGIPARRRSWRNLLGIIVAMAVIGGLSSCGGSSGGGGGGGGNSGTTAGTYTFTVTGNGNPTVTPAPSNTFTVSVN